MELDVPSTLSLMMCPHHDFIHFNLALHQLCNGEIWSSYHPILCNVSTRFFTSMPRE